MNIFVYGTLKTGFCRNHYLTNQTFIKKTKTTPNYRLYKVSDFPGLRVEENGLAIEGELWEIDAACLQRLDRMEGHPTLFKRTKIELESGEDAEAYLWQGWQEESQELGQDIGTCWT